MRDDEFIIEEEEEVSGSPSNRLFRILAGVLGATLLIGIICVSIVLLSRQSADTNDAAVAARLTENATIAIYNTGVAQTVAARETEAAIPTDTPQPTATNTATAVPTDTPTPTHTPVIQQAEETEEPEEAGEDTPTPDFSGTSVFESSVDDTPTPISAAGTGRNDSDRTEALPDTGLNTWGALVLAVGLIITFAAARRLRRS